MIKIFINTLEKIFWGYFIWTVMSIYPVELSRNKIIDFSNEKFYDFFYSTSYLVKDGFSLIDNIWHYITINIFF